MATVFQIALDRTRSFGTLYIFASRTGLARLIGEVEELASGRSASFLMHPSPETYSEEVGRLAFHVVSEPKPAGRLRRLVRAMMDQESRRGIACRLAPGGYMDISIRATLSQFEDLVDFLKPVLNGPNEGFCKWGANAADSLCVVVELRHLLPFHVKRAGLRE